MSDFLFPLVAATFLTVCLLGALYVWIKRKTYTRERFAFVLLSSCLAGFLLLSNALIVNATPVQQFIDLLQYFKTGDLPAQVQLPTLTITFLIIIYGMMCLVGTFLFKNWDGGQSLNDRYSIESKNELSLIRMGVNESLRLLLRKQAESIYIEKDAIQKSPNLGQVTNTPWNELARTLLSFQKNVLESWEWRSEHEFWLATHKDHEHYVAIKCSIKMPTEIEIRNFISYLKKMPSEPKEYYIVIKTGDVQNNVKIDGIEIKVYSKNELLDKLINFDEYCDDIKKRASEDVLIGSGLTLSDTYTPTRFIKENHNEVNESNLEDAVNDWLNDPSNTQLALLGEYGQGKSTSALMITHHLLSQGIENLNRIPILIELRGKSPKTMTPGEILSTWGAHKYDISSRKLEALHLAGRLLLIFDGFDEMDLVGNPQDRLSHFQSLWRFNHSNAKLIITGRPNLFLDDRERKSALGLTANSVGALHCESWELMKFNPQEINNALRSSPKAVRVGILQAIEKNPTLIDIAGRPSLLQAMSILWENGKLQEDVEQLTSAKVIQLFIDLTLSRQSEKANKLGSLDRAVYQDDTENYMVLNFAERLYFMQGIAVYMMKNKDTNQIKYSDLEYITEQLAMICPQSVTNSQASYELYVSSHSINQRIEMSRDFLGRLKDDVRTCGLLVTDVNDGEFRFSHKSFLEYLVADYADRLYASDKYRSDNEYDDVQAIKQVTETSFPNILKNNVTSLYFAELAIERRSSLTPGNNNPETMSKFLLEYMLNPSWFRKKSWAISLRILNFKLLQNTKHTVWAMYCRNLFIPTLAGSLNYFSIEKYFGRREQNQSLLARAWVGFSESNGCSLNQLYYVLSGGNEKLVSLESDPLGLLTNKYHSRDKCYGESNEWLRYEIENSLILENRSEALAELIFRWALDRNESESESDFNKIGFMMFFIFSLDLKDDKCSLFYKCIFRVFTILMSLPLSLVRIFLYPDTRTFIIATSIFIIPISAYLTDGSLNYAILLQIISLIQIILINSISDDKINECLYEYFNLGKKDYIKEIEESIIKFSEQEDVSISFIKDEINELSDYLGWDIKNSFLPEKNKG